MNLASVSQSVILAGESPEVDVLARRAVPVPAETRTGDPKEGSMSRDVALQFTLVGQEADFADPSRHSFLNTHARTPLDLYRRVQRGHSPHGSRQLVDVFA